MVAWGMKMKTLLTLGWSNPPTSTHKFISPHQTQMENGHWRKGGLFKWQALD